MEKENGMEQKNLDGKPTKAEIIVMAANSAALMALWGLILALVFIAY